MPTNIIFENAPEKGHFCYEMMKNYFILFLTLILFTTNVKSQTSFYFGESQACAVVYSINFFYSLRLNENQTFCYNQFYLDEGYSCQSISGTWSTSEDTLFLKQQYNNQIYYYLIHNDTIKSPNENIFRKIMMESDDIINKGVDDFGLGVTYLTRLDVFLSDKKRKRQRYYKNWGEKTCH